MLENLINPTLDLMQPKELSTASPFSDSASGNPTERRAEVDKTPQEIRQNNGIKHMGQQIFLCNFKQVDTIPKPELKVKAKEPFVF